eukprot:3785256-Rhodomonas_salina.2
MASLGAGRPPVPPYPARRNQTQETTFSVQLVPGMRFLVFKFALKYHQLCQCLVRYRILVPLTAYRLLRPYAMSAASTRSSLP